jgi:hypothetical protein
VVVAEQPLLPRVVPQHLHLRPLQHPLLALPQPAHPLDVGPVELAVVADADVVALALHRLRLLLSTRSWTRFSPMAAIACIR